MRECGDCELAFTRNSVAATPVFKSVLRASLVAQPSVPLVLSPARAPRSLLSVLLAQAAISRFQPYLSQLLLLAPMFELNDGLSFVIYLNQVSVSFDRRFTVAYFGFSHWDTLLPAHLHRQLKPYAN